MDDDDEFQAPTRLPHLREGPKDPDRRVLRDFMVAQDHFSGLLEGA